MVISLVSLLDGCGRLKKRDMAQEYINNLSYGDTLRPEIIESIGWSIHKVTKDNLTYRLWGGYYITVDPKSKIIKSIYVSF